MKELLLVASGGAFGASARYALSGFILHHTLQHKFPYGTFTINVLGCLLAGLFAGFAEKHQLFTPEARLLLLTGVLGGFTTFSAFGVETFHLFRRGDVAIAVSYVMLSLLCGLLVLWLAYLSVPVKK